MPTQVLTQIAYINYVIKNIIANIAPNRRNTTGDNVSSAIDEDLYKERYSIERTNA
jgi:hypothetical protein